jgi:NADPH-dependent glutamate synthase beta subunit-like oxidoreductase
MMQFGIPANRLPRNILAGEIERIERLGVKIVLNHRVRDLAEERGSGRFDAVFLAVGAHLGKRTEIPARDAGQMLEAVSFLRSVRMGSAPALGRRVAIYGGGNTAMDAARTALRLGSDALIIYRRDQEHMPAHDFEAVEAMNEGVKIHWLRTIKSIEGATFTVEKMDIDANGRPQPSGEFETLEADDLIMAVGQDVDSEFLSDFPGIAHAKDGSVVVDSDMMTGCPGVFASGDMVTSNRTVTVAVGHGKKAARGIDAYLKGTRSVRQPSSDIADFDKLRLWFYGPTRQADEHEIALRRRRASFEEVRQGLTELDAVHEAKRCLSCGNCFECDGCYGACPEGAIIKIGKGLKYRVDYDRCNGCAICFDQCPSHAIAMEVEP